MADWSADGSSVQAQARRASHVILKMRPPAAGLGVGGTAAARQVVCALRDAVAQKGAHDTLEGTICRGGAHLAQRFWPVTAPGIRSLNPRAQPGAQRRTASSNNAATPQLPGLSPALTCYDLGRQWALYQMFTVPVPGCGHVRSARGQQRGHPLVSRPVLATSASTCHERIPYTLAQYCNQTRCQVWAARRCSQECREPSGRARG